MKNGYQTLSLDLSHLDEVVKIEQNLPDNESLVIKSTNDEIKKCLQSEMSVGIFVEGTLVSYSLCYGDDYSHTCYVEKCVTLDSHCGKGFQSETISAVLEKAKEKGYIMAVAMVSPFNSVSLYNFGKCGFDKVTLLTNVLGTKYNRNLLECKLK